MQRGEWVCSCRGLIGDTFTALTVIRSAACRPETVRTAQAP